MYRRRINILFAALSAAFLILAGRLAHLQFVRNEAEYTRQTDVRPFRGGIITSDGVVLAVDRPSYDVTVPYRHLGRDEHWRPAVHWATGVPEDELAAARDRVLARVGLIRANVDPKYKRIYEQTIPHAVATDVDLAAVARIEANPDRFRFNPRDWFTREERRKRENRGRWPKRTALVKVRQHRAYPQGRAACHVLGYLGRVHDPDGRDPFVYGPGDSIGVAGVEKQYDRLLRGRHGVRIEERNLKTRVWQTVFEDPAHPGHTMRLTLDSRVQRAAETALGERIGGVVAMDVRTGALLAVASAPGYDVNTCLKQMRTLSADRERRPLLNRATQDPVPCGSVMKIVDAVAALQRGAITPDTTFHCSAVYTIGKARFHCSARYGHGRVALGRAIERSCNVYFFHVARRLGGAPLAHWAGLLGLGRRTGVDIPFEWRGRVPSPAERKRRGRRWYPGDTLNLCIGQGDVQVTPLQVAVMLSAVANGGFLVRPHVLLGVADVQGRPVRAEALAALRKSERLPVAAEHLAVVRRGLARVVTAGTARGVPGLREVHAAGKTGTAETADREINHCWFAGYAPADAPEICVVAAIHRARGHGADVAGPVVAAVMKAYFAAKSDGAAYVRAGE